MKNWKLLCILFLAVATVKSDEIQEEADAFMEEMKESDNTDPKTPADLAYETLKKAFEKTTPTGLSLMQVLEKIETFKGPARYYALRMFEKMDENMDGQITASEMAFVYSGPVSSEQDVLKFIFQIKDFDGDGFITPWEMVREKMILEGNILPISTLWKNAMNCVKKCDLDKNGVIDLEEFMLATVMVTDISIVQVKLKEKGIGPNGSGLSKRKFSAQKATLRKAHSKVRPPFAQTLPLELSPNEANEILNPTR